MVNKSVVLKKISHIRHNLSRLHEKKGVTLACFKNDLDTQDVVIHNLQLAIQGCIGIGNHIISDEGWGVAGSLSEIFYILQDKGIIKKSDLIDRLISMIGFRNILVHEYEDVNIDIVFIILQNCLKDIEDYLLIIVDYFKLD